MAPNLRAQTFALPPGDYRCYCRRFGSTLRQRAVCLALFSVALTAFGFSFGDHVAEFACGALGASPLGTPFKHAQDLLLFWSRKLRLFFLLPFAVYWPG